MEKSRIANSREAKDSHTGIWTEQGRDLKLSRDMKDIGKETESGRDHRQSVGAEDTLSAGMAEGSCGAGIRRGVTGDKGSPEEHLREEASECGHPEHGIRGLQQAGQMESVDGEERGGNLWRLGT